MRGVNSVAEEKIFLPACVRAYRPKSVAWNLGLNQHEFELTQHSAFSGTSLRHGAKACCWLDRWCVCWHHRGFSCFYRGQSLSPHNALPLPYVHWLMPVSCWWNNNWLSEQMYLLMSKIWQKTNSVCKDLVSWSNKNVSVSPPWRLLLTCIVYVVHAGRTYSMVLTFSASVSATARDVCCWCCVWCNDVDRRLAALYKQNLPPAITKTPSFIPCICVLFLSFSPQVYVPETQPIVHHSSIDQHRQFGSKNNQILKLHWWLVSGGGSAVGGGGRFIAAVCGTRVDWNRRYRLLVYTVWVHGVDRSSAL